MDQTTLMPDVAPAPPQKSDTGTAECTVNTRDLLKEMNLLQRVVARKTTAPILTHLHLQAVGKNLVLTATDARISLRTLNANSAEHIQFADDNSTLYFAVGSRLLTSQLMSGKFPNYEVVLPKGEAKKVIVSRQELLLSLQRVAQFADSKSNAVRVRIAPNELRLCSSSSEIGESEDVVPTTFAGPPKLIGYNSQYLLDFLRVVDCENVCLEFKVEELPTEFKPEDADKDFSLRCVIMPLKI